MRCSGEVAESSSVVAGEDGPVQASRHVIAPMTHAVDAAAGAIESSHGQPVLDLALAQAQPVELVTVDLPTLQLGDASDAMVDPRAAGPVFTKPAYFGTFVTTDGHTPSVAAASIRVVR